MAVAPYKKLMLWCNLWLFTILVAAIFALTSALYASRAVDSTTAVNVAIAFTSVGLILFDDLSPLIYLGYDLYRLHFSSNRPCSSFENQANRRQSIRNRVLHPAPSTDGWTLCCMDHHRRNWSSDSRPPANVLERQWMERRNELSNTQKYGGFVSLDCVSLFPDRPNYINDCRFSSISMFYLVEQHGKGLHLSLIDFRPSLIASRSGFVDTASASIKTFISQDDQLYLIPERRPSQVERQQYLQRRNSASSQRAMYPNTYRTFEARPRYQSHRVRRTPSRLLSLHESSTADSTDANSMYSSSTGTSGSSCGDSSWSTYARTMSLRSCQSCVDTNSTPLSPLLEQRYELEASIPEKTDPKLKSSKHSENNHQLAPTSPEPPAWCPKTLKHAPLSSDPAIRALASGERWKVSNANLILPPPIPTRNWTRISSAPTMASLALTNSTSTSRSVTLPTRSSSASVATSVTTAIINEAIQVPVPVRLRATAVPPIPLRAPGHVAKTSYCSRSESSLTSTSSLCSLTGKGEITSQKSPATSASTTSFKIESRGSSVVATRAVRPHQRHQRLRSQRSVNTSHGLGRAKRETSRHKSTAYTSSNAPKEGGTEDGKENCPS